MNNLGTSFVDENFRDRDTIGQCVGGVIRNLKMEDSELLLVLDDGTLTLKDDGQNCCESRYMTCDDNLAEFIGAHFTGLYIKRYNAIPQQPDEDGITRSDMHEVQWLEIVTSKGCITIAAHNEHNGYYGGFNITANFKGESK